MRVSTLGAEAGRRGPHGGLQPDVCAPSKGFFTDCTGCTGLFENTRTWTTSDVKATCKLLVISFLRLSSFEHGSSWNCLGLLPQIVKYPDFTHSLVMKKDLAKYASAEKV